MGAKNVFIWDIDADKHVTDDWVTTGGGTYSNADLVKTRVDQLFESGGGDIYNANGPGFDYDSAADAMVAWVNEGGPYVLDLKTKIWTRMSDDDAPTHVNSGGTFGRWRYVPSLNVFILVNSVDENVYFYKHTRCGG
ncbi:MAG: hypothetical protein H6729_08725 [Deltaproteobacteria bacterium]|nr:hypothetical protein [Deltaproteobacteria bacterium]